MPKTSNAKDDVFVQKARRTKSNKFYGLNRVDRDKGGKLRDGWLVVVTGVGSDGKQRHLFPVKHFADESTPTKKGYAAKIESRNAAMQYRDEQMRSINREPPKSAEIVVRERTTESKFTRSKTRTEGDMYGISRDPRTKTPSLAGWRVRVKGQSKHFSDNGNGGMDAALEAAKKWRDSMLGDEAAEHTKEEPTSRLREARIKAGISQDQAAQWMHVSQLTFARHERNVRKALPAFEDLFCRYAEGVIHPVPQAPRLDLTEVRISLGKTQREMSQLITGSKSQAPWANWETGKTAIPGWVLCYINQIGFNKNDLSTHE